MKSNSKVCQYDKLKKDFELILKHEDSDWCLKTYNAQKNTEDWSKIVKIENAEAKRANRLIVSSN